MGSGLSITIPAPTGGWNAKDPLDIMPENDAVSLVNIFPETGTCTFRSGFREHADSMGTDEIQTLAQFVKADGTKYLLAGANGNIYNASTYGGAGASLGSGFTSNKWQTTNFRASGATYIVFFNGFDQPKKWDGTTFNDATYTHANLADDLNLIQGWPYKNHMYVLEKEKAKIYFVTTVDAVQGALTEFEVGPILRRGGGLLWGATWSRDSGGGLEELMVLCSDQGEILVYAGDNPSASNWGLVGRYYLPTPIGRRSWFNLDADLVVLTVNGAIPLSRVLGGTDMQQVYTSVTDKIQNAFNSAARDYSSNFGWEGAVYARGHYLLLNIPIVDGGRTEQYVMNTYTGAWCRFTGQNASTWCIFNSKLYFGGMDGKIYEADYGTNDNDQPTEVALKTAFSYCGDRSVKKRFLMVRPTITGSDGLEFLIDVDTDFSNKTLTGTASTVGSVASPWNDSPWNTTGWSAGSELQTLTWYGVTGIGRNVSVRLEGDFQDVRFSVSAFHLTFQPGNYL
jgi:hypothetical protein